MNTGCWQHDAWVSGAADAWFERNRAVLDADLAPARSTVLYARYLKPGQRVVEIGTTNGHVLEQLRRLSGCEAHGIDPSHAAVQDGIARYPKLKLHVGTADLLPYEDGYFDAVLFGFCLYVVDRRLLMRVVAEADRVLIEGGKLMITDFDPAVPHRRAFKHQVGIWSYKVRYPDLWLANPAYVLVDKLSFSHEGEVFHEDPNERLAAWVLYKQGLAGYPELR